MGHRPLRMAAALGAIVLAAAALRFARLSAPPVWLDEAVTALIAAGRGPDWVADSRIVPLSHFADLYNPRVAAPIGDALAVYFDPRVHDLHPPTFHIIANIALRAGIRDRWPLVARVRAIAAVFGIAAVILLYAAARQAFDARVALIAAALMAVSPFAVMLSRETRNYGLLLLAISATTGAFLAVRRAIAEDRDRMWPWLIWAFASAAALYVHYFALFSWLAHSVVIGSAAIATRSRRLLLTSAAAIGAVGVAFVPLLPLLLRQESSPEQRWLSFDVHQTSVAVAPYRIGTAWQTMLLGKAWDLGPEIYAASRTIALAFFLVVLASIVWSISRSAYRDAAAWPVRALLMVIALVLVQFVAVMALRGKDYVSEARYQSIYYPPFAIVVAWALAQYRVGAIAAVIAAGLLNSVMVTLDVESWKAGDPVFAATRLASGSPPALVIAGVASFNEAVVHSINLYEMQRRAPHGDWSAVFVPRTPEYASMDRHAAPATFWSAVAALHPKTLPASLLVHSANMQPAEYLREVTIVSAGGEAVSCAGVMLGDGDNALDDLLTHTAYRRYACTPLRAADTP